MKIDEEMLKRILEAAPAPEDYKWVRDFTPVATDRMLLVHTTDTTSSSFVVYPSGEMWGPTISTPCGEYRPLIQGGMCRYESEGQLVETMKLVVSEAVRLKGLRSGPIYNEPKKRFKKNFSKTLPQRSESSKKLILKVDEDQDTLGIFQQEWSASSGEEYTSCVFYVHVDVVSALMEGIDETLETKVLKTGGQRLYESEVGEFPDSGFDSKRLTWEELPSASQRQYEDRAQKLGIVAIEEWPEV